MEVNHARVEMNAIMLHCTTMTEYYSGVMAKHETLMFNYKMCLMELQRRAVEADALVRERDDLVHVARDLAFHLDCAEDRVADLECDLEHEIHVHAYTRARLLATELVNSVMSTCVSSARDASLQNQVASLARENRVLKSQVQAMQAANKTKKKDLKQLTEMAAINRRAMAEVNRMAVDVMHAEAMIVDLKVDNRKLSTKLEKIGEIRDTSVLLLSIACKERDEAVRELLVAREVIKSLRST